MERNIEEMPENVEDETNVTPVSTNASKSKIEKSEEIEHVLPANNAKCSGDDLDDINKDKQTLNGNEIKYNQDQCNEKENRIDSKKHVDENHPSENTHQHDTESLEKKPSFETFESTKLTPNEGTYTDKTESCDMNIAVKENKTLQLEPSSGDLKEKSLVSIEKDPDNESDSGKLQRCEDDDEDIYVDMSHAQGKESIISIYGSTKDNINTEVSDSQPDTIKPKSPEGPPPVPTLPEDHIYNEINYEEMNLSPKDVPPELPKTPRPTKINTFSDSTDGILQPLHIIDPSQPDIASDRLRKIILDEVPNDISIKEIHVNIERELLSKGDDFEDITLNRTLKEAVVTLKNSTAADELLKRARSGKHFILKEKHVSIAHYEQTSLDPTKILLLGLNEESTTQFVSSQIKSICGVQPLSVIKGVDPTIAMLVFDSNTDLTEFQCKLKANETKWMPLPVERTCRVRVQGVPMETTPNALEHYLKQFSKDGSIHHIKYIKYRDVWNDYIISFTKDEDADALVRAGPHKLNEAELEVSLYYPFLAGDEEYFLNTPAPFKIDDLNIYICRFLQESQQPKKDVEEIVESHHGKIIWPDTGMERKLYIQCNIDENDKTAIAKVKDWKENITGVVAQICKMFSVKIQYFALEIKSQLRSRIESVGSTNPDSFFIKIEENRVVIAGYQNDAEKWASRVENMITSIEQEHDSQGKYLTKTMKLKPFEFELLDASNSFEKLKNVERTLKNKTLVLKGRKQMVDSAVNKVVQMIRDFPKKDIKGLSPMVLALLHTSKTNHYVKQILMKSEVTGCWHFVGQGTLELYSLTCNGLITVERCIRSCFRSTSLEIERELRDHLQQEKFLAKLETEYKEKVQFDCSTNRLLILSWDSLHDEIVEKVKKFLDLHTNVSEDFHLDPGEFRYLFSYKKTSIRKILQHYEDMNVEIDVLDKLTRKGFAVKGERKSCKTAIAHLRDFVAETITRDEHTVNSHELSKYFGTSEGIDKLKTFELSEKCVIRISTPESQVVPTNVCLSECRIGGCEIQILKGDITEAEVDFIVIPNESTFDHKYGLARTIIDKGGFSIQRECQQYISEAKCVNDGDTFITSSGHLPCREIIHVVLPVWTKENSEKESIISNAVTKCLLEGENRKATSIAFPPLGAGRFRYPSDVIVEQMIKSIKEYLMENGADTCLRHIYMHDVEKESSLLFVKAMKNEIPQSTILIPEMLTESRAEANELYGYNIYPEIVTGSLVSQDASIFLFLRPEHMINYGKSLFSN
ncbi:uncharacterized protein LOC132755435 [Ruditapes philippinarum]|uniref:uncharacterized protein LOC132755435 n=1 Tax=Ruditapes philippinarum TaxID=129788 RepID=UPI00295B4FA0|nr:uncharacterized protein LOC132755435 [Ruditapes philippinarum]